MGMFLNYKNISKNYVPNNLINAFPTNRVDTKLDPVEFSKPYEEFNSKGELEGYSWRYGETLNLEFNIDGEITVEDDAIVTHSSGVMPSTNTVGNVGQRFYNVCDNRSFTCSMIDNGNYVWDEDSTFSYPTNAGRSVYVPSDVYLKDKNVCVTIYNFRMEKIIERVFPGKNVIIFDIDSELSKELVRGIYYCSVCVFDDSTNIVIFESTDCKLIVK